MAKIQAQTTEFTIATDDDGTGIHDAATTIYHDGGACGEIVTRFDAWSGETTFHLSPATLPAFIVGLYVGDYHDDDATRGYTFGEPGHEFAN